MRGEGGGEREGGGWRKMERSGLRQMSKREILPEFESLNTKHLTQNPRQRARVYVGARGRCSGGGIMYTHMCAIHRRSL